MSDEEREALEILELYFGENSVLYITKYVNIVLNLIKKQSKKIEELSNSYDKLAKECNEENRRCMLLAVENQDLKEKNKFLNWYFENQKENFIHKDKIKAKIEELEKLDFGTDLVSQFTANLTTITILQSLLEKE